MTLPASGVCVEFVVIVVGCCIGIMQHVEHLVQSSSTYYGLG